MKKNDVSKIVSEFEASVADYATYEMIAVMERICDRYSLNTEISFPILIKAFAVTCKNQGYDYKQYKKFTGVILDKNQYEALLEK